MAKKRSNSILMGFFAVVAFIAVMVLWVSVNLAPEYFNYFFSSNKNNNVSKDHTSAEKRSLSDPVKDPFITRNPNIDIDSLSQKPEVRSSNPSLGKKDADVTIVQFSDFQCQYCHQQEETLKKLKNKYNDRIRLIWKDYPVNNQQSPSWRAASAARCAQKQDKFWSYHNKLYQTEKNLDQETFLRLSSQEDLDVTAFKKCLNSPQINDLIKKDIQEANSLGITGIPFLYINNQEVMGRIDKKGLEKIIEVELRK